MLDEYLIGIHERDLRPSLNGRSYAAGFSKVDAGRGAALAGGCCEGGNAKAACHVRRDTALMVRVPANERRARRAGWTSGHISVET